MSNVGIDPSCAFIQNHYADEELFADEYALLTACDKTYNKTCEQRRLRPACSVWSESSLIACAFYSLLAIQRGIYENSCYTGWMYRLIWVFARHTDLIVGFVVRWLIYTYVTEWWWCFKRNGHAFMEITLHQNYLPPFPFRLTLKLELAILAQKSWRFNKFHMRGSRDVRACARAWVRVSVFIALKDHSFQNLYID